MGLVGSSWSKNDPVITCQILQGLSSGQFPKTSGIDPKKALRFCDFERREHASRSPAGTYACTVVYGRTPCVPRSREREKRPAARSIPQKQVNFIHVHVMSCEVLYMELYCCSSYMSYLYVRPVLCVIHVLLIGVVCFIPSCPCRCTALMVHTRVQQYPAGVFVVVAVFTSNRSFYPTTSAAPPVSFLILHPGEIPIMCHGQ